MVHASELAQVNMRPHALVMFSSCLQRATDPRSLLDELPGMPSACLRAGAAAVIAPLWSIADLSSGIFTLKFHHALSASSGAHPHSSIAERVVLWAGTLSLTTRWLRRVRLRQSDVPPNSKDGSLEAFIQSLRDRCPQQTVILKILYDRVQNMADHKSRAQCSPIFAHPFFWAAYRAYA